MMTDLEFLKRYVGENSIIGPFSPLIFYFSGSQTSYFAFKIILYIILYLLK